MQLNNMVYAHLEYYTQPTPFQTCLEKLLLDMELNGYVVLRTTVPDSHHVIRIMGKVGETGEVVTSTLPSTPRQLHKTLANKNKIVEMTSGVDTELLLKLFSSYYNLANIKTGAYILDGMLYSWGNLKITKLDSLGNCTTPRELSEFILRTSDESHRSEVIPPAYVSLIQTELTLMVNRFLAGIPKKSLQKRIHLAAFLREFTVWIKGLNQTYRGQYASIAVIGECLKRVWMEPSINRMRTDFKNDGYYDSRLEIDWRFLNVAKVNYVRTLALRVEGVWDPVAQCQGV